MNTETDLIETAAPVFVPQPPPPGLGVLRGIILALMVLVGSAELLLAAGVALHIFN